MNIALMMENSQAGKNALVLPQRQAITADNHDAVGGKHFQQCLFEHGKDAEIIAPVRQLIQH